MTLDEKRERYQQLLHAMQTGVAYVMTKDGSGTSPKHLRVGVNSSLLGNTALVRLLIEKGVISEEEYLDALIVELEAEVERYTDEVRALYGSDKITLR